MITVFRKLQISGLHVKCIALENENGIEGSLRNHFECDISNLWMENSDAPGGHDSRIRNVNQIYLI